MKISFNKISNIKVNNIATTMISFRSADLPNDMLVKNSHIEESSADNETAGNLIGTESSGFNLQDFVNEICQRVQQEFYVSTSLDNLSSKSIIDDFKFRKAKMPVAKYLDLVMTKQSAKENHLQMFNLGNIKTCADLARFLELYHQNQVKNVFRYSLTELFEIYGKLNDKDNVKKYPELLLALIHSSNDDENVQNDNVYEKYCQFFDKLGIKDLPNFIKTFDYLKPEFNSFETNFDVVSAIKHVESTNSKKTDLLKPIIENFKNNKNLKSPEQVYFSIPDIVDYLYEKNNGENLGELQNYIDMAVSHSKFSSKIMSVIQSDFNKFSLPEDKIRFYKLLKQNNVSISDFNKIFSNTILSDYEPMSLIYNKQSIVNSLSENDKKYQHTINDIYLNFADVLNVAYESENSSSNLLFETYDVIKKCKFKNSQDLLNYYNQVNSPNPRVKNITSDNLVEFIDLMKFVEKSEFSDAKKFRKVRLDSLRQLRNEYNRAKEPIETFLLNFSNNLFLNETTFSIFDKYKSEFIGASEEDITSKLSELDRFNIKNAEENYQKNLEMDKFKEFFSSRKDLINFVIKNEISFNNSQDEAKYKENCRSILYSIYITGKGSERFENISKLSDSKFLINSKNTLPNLLNLNLSTQDKAKAINTFVNKNVKNYASFEAFVNKYEVDNNSFMKLVDFISNLPEDVSFEDVLPKLEKVEKLLKTTNYPITLNADNIGNLTYDDLQNSYPHEKILPDRIKILNKLVGLGPQENPIVKLPKSNMTDFYTNKYKIAAEIFQIREHSDNYPKLVKLLYDGELEKDSVLANIHNYISYIPNEFVDFVKKMNVLNGKEYNMTLHSKLRIIERFLMDDIHSMEDFNSPNVKKELKKILKSIYLQKPIDMESSSDDERLILDSLYKNTVLENIFSKDGILITSVEKSHY